MMFERDRKREEKWLYQPLAREILGNMAYHRDVSHLTKPDMALIKWLAKEGGAREYAVKSIIQCAYRGLLGDGHKPIGEMQSDEERKMRTYNYVPSGRARFAYSILPLFYGKRRFVDVGSGYADKPLLAHVYGKFDSVTGIEINAFTHSAAVLLLGSLLSEDEIGFSSKGYVHHQMRLLNENAFDVSYRKYDAVYMYMPIANAATMTKLHVHVINTMPKGGLLYEVQSGLFNRRRWAEDGDCWWECRCPDCRDGEEDKCKKEGENISFLEYAEEVGAPIKRKIRISNDRHLIEVL